MRRYATEPAMGVGLSAYFSLVLALLLLVTRSRRTPSCILLPAFLPMGPMDVIVREYGIRRRVDAELLTYFPSLSTHLKLNLGHSSAFADLYWRRWY